MTWNEFCYLIEGLRPETPLGDIVGIRSENDKDILKNFSPSQLKIRNDYRRKMNEKINNKEIDEEEYNKQMKEIASLFAKIGTVKTEGK